jgi:2-octaprenylphenol hydroxylase
MNQTRHYDLIIAGAGMVGATLANALADSKLRIAIIENCKPEITWPKNSVDLRVSAITRASEQIFTHLEVWPSMQAHGISPFRNMFVWDSEGDGEIHFDSADVGAAHLGHIIENRIIQASLITRLKDFDNIEMYCPTEISSLQQGNDQISVCLDDGSMLISRLLIGADGGRSCVRDKAGIETRGWSYQQQAVVTVVETEQRHQQTAWQRFMPSGPLAFLPLADGRSSIVWTTSPEQAEQLLACDDADFRQQLGLAFDFRLGAITANEQRTSFPLQRQHAKHYIKHRIALIGDAAHTIHPLAGQGVNLGLLDAAALAEVILDTDNTHHDIGGQRALRRYERWRKGDNLVTMGIMDGFKNTFGSRSEPLRWLRNTGLNLADNLPPLKQHLILQAMGQKSDLPLMARPVL